MKKILIVLTSHGQLGTTEKPTGYYLSEVSHPYFVFDAAGFEVDFVSPTGGECPIDGLDVEDEKNTQFLADEIAQMKVKNSAKPSDINGEDYAAIFYAGGHGTMWDFPENTELAKISAEIYEAGGSVGAVCHGPAGLVNTKLSNGEYLVSGKDVSCFTNEEETFMQLEAVVPFLLETKLVARGASMKKAPNFETSVAVSERLVTGQNPASATGVAEAMVELIA